MQEARNVFFPYCLRRLGDGRYIFLNRGYKPVGNNIKDWIEYENDPGAVHLELTPSQIKQLSVDGKPDSSEIYLYNDGCVPTDNSEYWASYSEKLELLAKVRIR